MVNNQKQISDLAQRFVSYSFPVNNQSISSYLTQFDFNDMGVGLKLLQKISYYDPASMLNLTKKLKQAVYEMNGDSFEDVIFCPMSTTSGNSADMMKRFVRMTASGSSASRQMHDRNFMNNVMDLSLPIYSEDQSPKKIVFLDHFIGSGDSILTPWSVIKRWQNSHHEYYVGTLVGYSDAIKIVEDESFSRLKILSVVELSNSARAFHNDSSIFTGNEKQILMQYCDNLGLDDSDRYGYKNGQSLVVFSSRVPDNVLPILYHETPGWVPLFPRYV